MGLALATCQSTQGYWGVVHVVVSIHLTRGASPGLNAPHLLGYWVQLPACCIVGRIYLGRGPPLLSSSQPGLWLAGGRAGVRG